MTQIRVLVVEDSPTTRDYVVQLIESESGLRVVETAGDGAEAIEKTVRLKPDVILMDVHMPHLDGLTATRRIMEQAPTPIVLMSASLERAEVALTFEALDAGAVTIVRKPPGLGDPRQAEAVRELLETLRLMAEVKVVRRWPPRKPAPRAGPGGGDHVRVIAIGASTGGPPVLAEILRDLPRDFGAPILVVQHIASGFTEGFVDWLVGQTALTVTLARDGEPVRPGSVYVAPEDRQMEVGPEGRVRLTAEVGRDGFRPSVSHTFASLAATHGRSAMGVLLTGMGRDGAAGLLRLREAGAVTVAQSEATSVVFGMPAEAVRLKAAQHVLSPGEIAGLMRRLAVEKP
jgi:two-component system chemotaxis response regulator CheB